MRRPLRGALGAALGKEGFAGDVDGGAGGTVFTVTNANDAGAGSLRQAITDANNTSPDPSIVSIEISDPAEQLITLEARIDINADNITMTGRDSSLPFLIRANPVDGSQWNGRLFHINGDNTLLEQLRIHRGLGNPDVGSTSTPLIVFGTRCLLRHCSIVWGEDVTAGTWVNTQNLTFQYCLLYEGLQNAHHDEGDGFEAHSKGVNFPHGPDAQPTIRANFAQSILAHGWERMPQSRADELEMTNCLIYNWGNPNTCGLLRGKNDEDVNSNIRGVMYIDGNDTPAGSKGSRTSGRGNGAYYVNDVLHLIAPGFTEERDPGQVLFVDDPADLAGAPIALNPIVETTVFPLDAMWKHLRKRVGATRPRRSASDIRVLEQIDDAVRKVALTGQIPDTPTAEDNNENPNATITIYNAWDDVL